jgi:hypothetical protein
VDIGARSTAVALYDAGDVAKQMSNRSRKLKVSRCHYRSQSALVAYWQICLRIEGAMS